MTRTRARVVVTVEVPIHSSWDDGCPLSMVWKESELPGKGEPKR